MALDHGAAPAAALESAAAGLAALQPGGGSAEPIDAGGGTAVVELQLYAIGRWLRLKAPVASAAASSMWSQASDGDRTKSIPAALLAGMELV